MSGENPGSASGVLGRAKLFFLRLASDDSGQSTTEYILILAAALVGAGAISKTIIQALDDGILRLGSTLERDLKTGKVSVGVWKN